MINKGHEVEIRAMTGKSQRNMEIILNKNQEKDQKIETKRNIGIKEMTEKTEIKTTEGREIVMIAIGKDKDKEMIGEKIDVKMIGEEATAMKEEDEIEEIEAIEEEGMIEEEETTEEMKELRKTLTLKRENKLKE